MWVFGQEIKGKFRFKKNIFRKTFYNEIRYIMNVMLKYI